MTNTWVVAALVLVAMAARAERTIESFNDG